MQTAALRLWCSPLTCLRYLRARKWQYPRALAALRATVAWRRALRPEELTWRVGAETGAGPLQLELGADDTFSDPPLSPDEAALLEPPPGGRSAARTPLSDGATEDAGAPSVSWGPTGEFFPADRAALGEQIATGKGLVPLGLPQVSPSLCLGTSPSPSKREEVAPPAGPKSGADPELLPPSPSPLAPATAGGVCRRGRPVCAMTNARDVLSRVRDPAWGRASVLHLIYLLELASREADARWMLGDASGVAPGDGKLAWILNQALYSTKDAPPWRVSLACLTVLQAGRPGGSGPWSRPRFGALKGRRPRWHPLPRRHHPEFSLPRFLPLSSVDDAPTSLVPNPCPVPPVLSPPPRRTFPSASAWPSSTTLGLR